MDTIAKYSLSAHMVEALKRSLSTSGHVITSVRGTGRPTEYALIRRGLAVAHHGKGTDRRGRTAYGVYLGASLNADGIAAAQALTA